MSEHNIPNYYFKCLQTGIEMVFTYTIGSGWTVGAPNGDSIRPILRYYKTTGRKIPWPDPVEKYTEQEKQFYDMLKHM